MAVGPKSHKAQQVNLIRLRKLFPESNGTSSSTETPETNTTPEPEAQGSSPDPAASIPCTNKSCAGTFATEGALYSHVNKEHVVCKHPGCLASFDTNRQMVPHHRIVHMGLAPRRIAKERGGVTDKRGRRLAAVPPQPTADTVEPKPTKPKPDKKKSPKHGFGSMTSERRSELARKGALKRWENARAEKARAEAEAAAEPTPLMDEVLAAQAPAEQPTPPAQAAADVPVGEHTREGVAAPTEALEAIARVDEWINRERAEWQERVTGLERQIEAARAQLGDAEAKLQLLREAWEA